MLLKPLKWIFFALVVFVGLGVITMMTMSPEEMEQQKARQELRKQEKAAHKTEKSSQTHDVIRASDFGEKWPFTVPEGVLRCSSLSSVTFTANGVIYAVNGSAMSDRVGYAPIESIWLINMAFMEKIAKATNNSVEEVIEISGTKRIGIGPIISAGLALCAD
jgi:hypothetical protein